MKNIFKFALVIFSVTALFSGCSNENSSKDFDREQVSELLGGVYEKVEIKWKDNSIVELRSIFRDTDYALEKIHEEAGGLITKLRFMYFLPKLTAENYEKYDAALWDYRLEKYGNPAAVPYEVSALDWCVSLLHHKAENENYIKMNGMDDDAAETLELLGTDRSEKIKILTADLLAYLAKSSDIGPLCEENFEEYKVALAAMDSEKAAEFEFECEILELFLSEE